MRALTAGQISHLAATKNYILADLYTFTLATGTIYRWTTYDADLSGFSHGGPVLSRTGARFVAGSETSTVEITMGDIGFMIGVTSRKASLAAAQGIFEAASVKIDRLYMPAPGDTSLGAIPWFEGTVAEVVPTSSQVKITVKSKHEQLSRPWPHRVIQPACPHVLYSAECGASKASNTFAKTVLHHNQLSVWFTDDVVARPAGYFTGGVVEFGVGTNVGQARMVSSHQRVSDVEALVVFDTPLLFTPVDGVDLFTISRGCNKMLRDSAGNPSDCITKFNRATNFGGFPYVPKPESMR